MRWLYLLAMLGGCHKLFDLEVVKLDPTGDGGTRDANDASDGRLPDASVECPTTVEFDEDGDSIDDRCDACPTIPSDNLDSDGDDLPNACDSDWTPGGDKILYWTTFFAESELGAFTRTGTTSWANSAVDVGYGSKLLLNTTLSPTNIEVNVLGIDGPPNGALRVGMAATPYCEVTASACANDDPSKLCGRLQPSTSQAEIPATPMELDQVRLYRMGTTSYCFLRGDSSGAAASQLIPIGAGQVIVETSADTATIVKSIVVYGAK